RWRRFPDRDCRRVLRRSERAAAADGRRADRRRATSLERLEFLDMESLDARNERQSSRLFQQPLRILEVRRIETLGEPTIDRREEAYGFGVFALIAPETCEAGRSTQLEKPCRLRATNRNCTLEETGQSEARPVLASRSFVTCATRPSSRSLC